MSELHVITKSRLAVFNQCQRLHHLQYNLGYRSLAPRDDADFGSLFHAGLEAWWLAYQDGTPMLALPNALAAMAKYRAEKAPAMDAANVVKAEILMAAYDARWASSMEEWEVLGVEVEFVATIPGRKLLRVAGKLDVLLRRRSDGTVWFVEHKTSGADLRAGSTYWQRLRMDPQVSIYFGGCRELGHEPVGCLYDVIERPGQRLLKATPVESRKYTKATKTEPSRLYKGQRETDETLDEFRERIGKLIADEPEAFFGRAEVVRLESELEESQRDVEETAIQIRSASQSGAAPRNPAACFMYGRTCEFLGPCSGVESLDDETKFRRTEKQHEELSAKAG
jgi:hypothetical protein